MTLFKRLLRASKRTPKIIPQMQIDVGIIDVYISLVNGQSIHGRFKGWYEYSYRRLDGEWRDVYVTARERFNEWISNHEGFIDIELQQRLVSKSQVKEIHYQKKPLIITTNRKDL